MTLLVANALDSQIVLRSAHLDVGRNPKVIALLDALTDAVHDVARNCRAADRDGRKKRGVGDPAHRRCKRRSNQSRD